MSLLFYWVGIVTTGLMAVCGGLLVFLLLCASRVQGRDVD